MDDYEQLNPNLASGMPEAPPPPPPEIEAPKSQLKIATNAEKTPQSNSKLAEPSGTLPSGTTKSAEKGTSPNSKPATTKSKFPGKSLEAAAGSPKDGAKKEKHKNPGWVKPVFAISTGLAIVSMISTIILGLMLLGVL